MNSESLYYCKRALIYCIGLFLLATGVSLSVLSNLGVSPLNTLPYVLSRITSAEMGLCTSLVFVGFIALQAVILRREFKMATLLQILCSFLFGYFVSLASACTSCLPACGSYPHQLLYLIASMALVALGILFYLSADLLSLPGEGVMQAVSYKSGIAFSHSKICFDCTMVAGAILLSYIFFQRLEGVREGTAIAAVGVGGFLNLFTRLWKNKLVHFLDRRDEEEEDCSETAG